MSKFLRQVTLKELDAWLKKNEHVTWGPKSWGSDGKAGSRRGKYVEIQLDTRTMTIFRLELRGLGGKSLVVDFRDSSEGSLLDELDRRLTEEFK